MRARLDRPPLDPARLHHELVLGGGPFTSVEVVEVTGSTNADLVDAARQGAPDRRALLAEEQRAGRGRLRRGWESPPRAGLTLSVLFRPAEVPGTAWGWLPLLTGLALVRVVRERCGVHAALKWPNDLLVGADGAKCAGILAEVAVPPAGPEGARNATGGQRPAVVVGVGLNVTQEAEELPSRPGAVPATSLALQGATETDRTTLASAFLHELADAERRWRDHSGDVRRSGQLATYRERCATLGTRVRLDLPGGGCVTGVAEDVDDLGQLVLRTDDGACAHYPAGDVHHLRAETRPSGAGGRSGT
ncbi:biotin--[acetyl-CoA-carboxylase] ligase [Actinoalloteichus spitiensis]|uniref:biotin--[acetyl-CoA-carboxylase] ligase n=1 Tax=Actinoalloteichus spitiensis TaxID=252394 RepID=UPI00035F2BF6|nr:biotin--[acetyl-CoA-carboxylase] ligase [Actinoalloteichus spitiensis]